LLLRLVAVFRFNFLIQELSFSYEFASDVHLILETFFLLRSPSSLRSQVFGANCGVPLALALYEQHQLSGHCHGQVPEWRSSSAVTHEGREDSENAAECLTCSLLLIDIWLLCREKIFAAFL
jgi:hypothetical protein